MRIKQLAAEINLKSFQYILIERTADKCLYRQESNGKPIAYEVFKTKIRNPIYGEKITNLFDKYESFPKDEEFGTRAWSYASEDRARCHYNAIGASPVNKAA